MHAIVCVQTNGCRHDKLKRLVFFLALAQALACLQPLDACACNAAVMYVYPVPTGDTGIPPPWLWPCGIWHIFLPARDREEVLLSGGYSTANKRPGMHSLSLDSIITAAEEPVMGWVRCHLPTCAVWLAFSGHWNGCKRHGQGTYPSCRPGTGQSRSAKPFLFGWLRTEVAWPVHHQSQS